MVLVQAPRRPSLLRTTPKAAFVSQLIAARQHLAPQRANRRAPIAEAVDAYRIGGAVTVLRMPAGYRRTVVA
jgi:hypothetical protein